MIKFAIIDTIPFFRLINFMSYLKVLIKINLNISINCYLLYKYREYL